MINQFMTGVCGVFFAGSWKRCSKVKVHCHYGIIDDSKCVQMISDILMVQFFLIM